MKDENSIKTREAIEKCIWKTDEFGNPDFDALKIDSEVATDNDKDDFLKKYPGFFAFLPTRILNNCILLPIEAESQDTALRIFSTLNDRGLPLSDADIFKAELYKFYKQNGKKDEFIARWKDLEDLAEFWKDVNAQDTQRFSDRVLRRLFVLSYAPNGMWIYLLSVYNT